MTSKLFNQAEVTADDYCIFGLATCFLREEGEVKEVQVIEPIPSAYLEAIIQGVETSYQMAIALKIGQVLSGDSLQIPPEFPSDSQFGEDFVSRMFSASRTYKSKPSAQKYLELGTIKKDFNYSLERKRILNTVNSVGDEDNVKQHPNTHKIL